MPLLSPAFLHCGVDYGSSSSKPSDGYLQLSHIHACIQELRPGSASVFRGYDKLQYVCLKWWQLDFRLGIWKLDGYRVGYLVGLTLFRPSHLGQPFADPGEAGG